MRLLLLIPLFILSFLFTPPSTVKAEFQIEACSRNEYQTCIIEDNFFSQRYGMQTCFGKKQSNNTCQYDPEEPEVTCGPCRDFQEDPGSQTCAYEELCDTEKYGPQSGKHLCVGSGQADACQHNPELGSTCSVCEPIYETKIYLNPQTQDQEKEVEVTITGTRSCSTDVNFEAEEALVDCTEGQSSCEEPNPTGDGKPCWWKFTCKADRVGSFTAKFTSAESNKCESTAPLTISQPQTCRPTQSQRASGDTSKVIAPSLGNDRAITNLWTDTLAPPEVKQDILVQSQAKAEIGVQGGFFGNLQSLLCNSFFRGLFSNLNFCPLPIDLASQSTDEFALKTELLAEAERPDSAKSPPSPKDCFLDDVQKPDGPTKGNQDTNKVNTSLGTKNGVYNLDDPALDNLPFDPARNLELGGVKFNDDRVPDVNARCKVYNDANFPEGIGPCYKGE